MTKASNVVEESFKFKLNGIDVRNLELAGIAVERSIAPVRFYKRPVGSFGIVGQDGKPQVINWVVTKPRKDERHGVVDAPQKKSAWYKYLEKELFRKW